MRGASADRGQSAEAEDAEAGDAEDVVIMGSRLRIRRTDRARLHGLGRSSSRVRSPSGADQLTLPVGVRVRVGAARL
ncbi:hypothetical protein GCM10018787_52510 [Streptomyces thermodiastaticus]|nr:hypothetical protein GCM10018787_52510 [Streptomyces thermodiastaticus]